MSDLNTNRAGVQRGAKRHDSTTTSSEPHETEASGTPTAANERRQKELLKKLPDSADNAQERASGSTMPRQLPQVAKCAAAGVTYA